MSSDQPPHCRICNRPLFLLDPEDQRWYCYRDDEVYLARENRWEGSAKPWTNMSPLPKQNQEIMLAQEQGVIMKEAGAKKRLEGGFGGELVGTLVLTNQRLIFVSTGGSEEHFHLPRGGSLSVFYSDVDDLESIPQDPNNLFIDIRSVSKVGGHRGGVMRPSLEVSWGGLVEERRVFVQRVTSGMSGRKDLGDWAPVILRLKDEQQPLFELPPVPSGETLEGKVIRVLADLQKKGSVTIQREIEGEFSIKVDPDELQSARLTPSALKACLGRREFSIANVLPLPQTTSLKIGANLPLCIAGRGHDVVSV